MKLSHLSLLVLFSLGCDKPATKIGTACTATADCNVGGQVCTAGICTHACTGQFGQCPVGFNCTIVDAAAGLTCNHVPFSVDQTTGAPVLYGKSCATDANACNGTGDPAATPLCRKVENPIKPGMPADNDAQAFCTAACGGDNDCPFFMYCGADYDGATKCLMRGPCSPCTYNDSCNADGSNKFACIPASKGEGNYCTPVCNSDNDCPGSVQSQAFGSKNYLSCRGDLLDAQGQGGRFCVHRYGACVGTGQICDPCRTDGDCAASSSKCIENTLTLERMCSKRCTTDAQCMSSNQSSCDNTDIPSSANPGGVSLGICTGDNPAPQPTGHQFPGDFSCWI